MTTYFVTGTDTDVGKTFVSVCLLERARQAGLSTLGFKPIAAGCQPTSGGLRNDDALALQQTATIKLPYEQVNPCALEPPIAPHIAAAKIGLELKPENLTRQLKLLQGHKPDMLLVEGAGGWSLPLGNGKLLSDWVEQQQMSVILVVGMRLGCLNHAILTAQRIQAQGLTLAGWVANIADPSADQTYYQENLATLQEALPGPLLGAIPYAPDKPVAELARRLRLP